MVDDNLPSRTSTGCPTGAGELEMNDWLKKLKENQERKREEKLRRYNDLVSKVIMILVGICIVSLIAIVALAVENNNLYKQNDQLKASYEELNITKNEQISKLMSDNNDLRQFIFSNRSNSVEYTVNLDPSLPKVSMITFNNNRIHFVFTDGSTKDVYFIDTNLYVNGQ
jgi:lipopolysaccharide/colanic/teichoic acid biosynthesis glycosyltransferase